MTRNPFCPNKDIFSKNLQEKFLKIKRNSTAKNKFEAVSLIDFRAKYVHQWLAMTSEAGDAIDMPMMVMQFICNILRIGQKSV